MADSSGKAADWFQPVGREGRRRLLYYAAAALLASLVPLIVIAGLWVRAVFNQNERDLRTGMAARAMTLSSQLDAEFAQQISVLQGIASLESLDGPDLRAFQPIAERMVEVIPQWTSLSLVDPSAGVQRMTTLSPLGSAPSGAHNFGNLVGVADKRKPEIFTRYKEDGNSGEVFIAVPVVRDQTARYVLVAAMKADLVQSIIQKRPADKMMMSVVDENLRVLARSRGVGNFLGRPVSQRFVEAVSGHAAGFFSSENMDSIRVYSAFQRSPTTGWITVAAIEREQMDNLVDGSLIALIGTGAVAVVLAGILAIFLFHNVVERRVNDERFAASRALNALDARLLTTTQDALAEQRKAALEREVLLREIYHRVKNNLQIIQSLLRLGSRHLKTEQREPFENAIRRIGAMARVHSLLYQSPELSSVDFKDYLDDVVSETARGFGADERDIKTKIDAQSMSVPLDTAVPLAFITVEILTNAFKHAFPRGRKGTLEIISRKEGDQGILIISDDGVGLSERLASERPLGLVLVRKLVEQIGGTLEAPAVGRAIYKVVFPLTVQSNGVSLPSWAEMGS